MKNWLIASSLFGLLGCSRAPTLLVTVDSLPSKAKSLQVISTHNSFAQVKDITPYELPQPTASTASMLLQLPSGFSGDIEVNVGAFDQAGGVGCLVGTGSGSSPMFAGPDDLMRLALTPTTDTVCNAMQPMLIGTKPTLAKTAGGDMVELDGWGFKPGVAVTMGSKPATMTNFSSASRLMVQTPAHAGIGLTNIKIANSDGMSVNRKDLFRFYNPAITFTSIPFPSKSSDYTTDSNLVVGHFNPATQIDAVATLPATGVVRIIGTVAGMVTNQQDYPVGSGAMSSPGAIVVGDFDKDGHPDVYVANIFDQTIQFLRNDGNGNLIAKTPVPVGTTGKAYLSALATADLNGDGLLDLAVTNGRPPSAMSPPSPTYVGEDVVHVFLNQGDGTMATQSGQLPLAVSETGAKPAASAPLSVSIGDLNGDGLPDVVVANGGVVNLGHYSVTAFFNQGGGRYLDNGGTRRLELPVQDQIGCTAPTSVIVFDTNYDGNDDILVSCSGSDRIAVILNLGFPSIRPIFLKTEGSPQRIALTDLNGDGVNDLIVPASTAGNIDVFLNGLTLDLKPAGFEGQQYVSLAALCKNPSQVAFLDVMGNGIPHIAVGGSGGLGILLNQTN